ncbi:phospholipase A [Aliikangiella maris]|uniref:Phospholipase A n=2 Tax=Aliikangiella maris TaxID=3162458 RepID=A0ABV2BQC1_9GAMM
MKQSHFYIFIVVVGLIAPSVRSNDYQKALIDCYFEQIDKGDNSRQVNEVKDYCKEQLHREIVQKPNKELTPLDKRIINERTALENPNVITSHNRNYMLPITYASHPNKAVYENAPGKLDKLDNYEAKFQISFKAPIAQSLIKDDDVLFFGFTIQSHWQMYNSDISAPFRETNYQPEIFYGFINDLKLGEWTNRVNMIGIEHQSNGRSQPLSRSWNRIYANFIWENDRWIIGFKPWYRIPEDEKEEPGASEGDDNPDIEKYMGHFELSTLYKWEEQTFSLMVRNNLRSENRGALQLDWTFPLGSRFKGYAQYFNGYGESMIDYNHSIERFGIGILLTDFF